MVNHPKAARQTSHEWSVQPLTAVLQFSASKSTQCSTFTQGQNCSPEGGQSSQTSTEHQTIINDSAHPQLLFKTARSTEVNVSFKSCCYIRVLQLPEHLLECCFLNDSKKKAGHLHWWKVPELHSSCTSCTLLL